MELRANYYTNEEYAALLEFGGIFWWVARLIELYKAGKIKARSEIKARLKVLASNDKSPVHHIRLSIYEAMYCTSIEEVPLMINEENKTDVAMWRLRIGK